MEWMGPDSFLRDVKGEVSQEILLFRLEKLNHSSHQSSAVHNKMILQQTTSRKLDRRQTRQEKVVIFHDCVEVSSL